MVLQKLNRRRDSSVVVKGIVRKIVKAIFGSVPVMGDFAERHDFVTEFLEVSGPFLEFRAGLAWLGSAPFLAGIRPVSKAARLGAQEGEAT